ncbi:MAG: FkbM family methyltransferase [Betaproteobacteria bacterium]|nr:FkbM family methyltransferase [Betaproteobacteria bacterium]
MSEDLTLAMPDGVRIVVPDDLRITSTYVLLEQQDWFEDEIRFLRAAMQPGMRAIDAGANFGVYTLALARCVGAGGRVWAVEPGEQAAGYLARSIATNGFSQVELIRCALSRADGSGFLQTGITPELRRLVRDDASAAVGVRSLDSLAAERGIAGVDFMKIDVEGEESNVLQGAAGFLARESPLLMIEFWGDRKFNTDIFAPLLRHGYDTYRLVPGINVLAPFYESEEPDAYQLNIFACRPPRAQRLAASGHLIPAPADKAPRFEREPGLEPLFAQPFAQSRAQQWRTLAESAPRESENGTYLDALRWFFAAGDKANSATARYWALEQAYLKLRGLIESNFTAGRGASFVRVAAAYGRRAEAVAASRRLVSAIPAQGEQAFAEPFLPPWPYQESLDPGPDLSAWLLASAVESYEHLFQFSSSDKTALAQESLNVRVDAQLLSPAYARREDLFKRRALAFSAPSA